MKHSQHRILTTHAGSLIRPPAVATFDAARQEGESRRRETRIRPP